MGLATLLLALAHLASACVGDDPAGTTPSSGGSDGGIDVDSKPDPLPDAGGDTAPSCEGDKLGYVLSNVPPCEIPSASGPLDLAGASAIDTDSGTLTTGAGITSPLPSTKLWKQAEGPEVRVVAVSALTVPSGTSVRFSGKRPIVFVVLGEAQIDGDLLLNATGATAGAGARSAMECGDSAGGRGSTGALAFGGGGGGGAYGAAGGAGGGGDGANGGTAGVPTLVARTPLVGGCPGGASNADTTSGGGAGGAIQISAGKSIRVKGTISVSGGGGLMSAFMISGGGGGSGGAILLEAKDSIAGEGKLTANGGGGAGANGAANGADGASASATPAAGGTCTGCLAGGAGGAQAQTFGSPGTPGAANQGGGGGGGGVGRLELRAPVVTFSGVSSPTAKASAL